MGQTIANDIVIDPTAQGYGWFVDTTPFNSTEFSGGTGPGQLQAGPGSSAIGKMDLLTVVMHEFGHVLGYGDTSAAESNDLMATELQPGVRRLPVEPSFHAVPALTQTTIGMADGKLPSSFVILGNDLAVALAKANSWASSIWTNQLSESLRHFGNALAQAAILMENSLGSDSLNAAAHSLVIDKASSTEATSHLWSQIPYETFLGDWADLLFKDEV